MNHSTGNPTRAERLRFEWMRMVGCVCCRKLKGLYRDGEIHHLTAGGRRRGHSFSVCLCEYHHRGVPLSDDTASTLAALGPSLAHGSRTFHNAYGSDDELLAYQEFLIGAERICGGLIKRPVKPYRRSHKIVPRSVA